MIIFNSHDVRYHDRCGLVVSAFASQTDGLDSRPGRVNVFFGFGCFFACVCECFMLSMTGEILERSYNCEPMNALLLLVTGKFLGRIVYT